MGWRGPLGGARRLLACRHGAAALEFALVGPFLIALILGILNIALVFLAQQGLQSAAEGAGRLIMTGQAQNGAWTAAQFKTQACNSLPPYMVCNRLYVDVSTATSYASATTGQISLSYDANGNVTNSFAYTTGSRGDIVVVRLEYLWPTSTAPMGLNLANAGANNRLITAVTVLKSEYY